jgi:hypothetical protein
MLIVLAIIVALIAALSVLPAGVEVRCTDNLCRVRLILCGLPFPLPQKKRASEQALPRSRKNFLRRFWPRYRSIAHTADIKLYFRTVRNILKCVHFRVKQLDVAIATPDPAITGMLYGLASAGISVLPGRGQISLYPDFNRTSPLVNGTASVTVMPLRILTAGLPLLQRLWRVRRRDANRVNS